MTPSSNPFFNPDWRYQEPNRQDWRTTPFVKDYLDPTIPQGVFGDYITSQGFGGTGREGDFARGLYGQAQVGYQEALRKNPKLTFLEYLNYQFGGNNQLGGRNVIRDMWNQADAATRGERSSLWVPNNRVIGWG